MAFELPQYLELMKWDIAQVEQWLKKNNMDEKKVVKEFRGKKLNGKNLANIKHPDLFGMKSLSEDQKEAIWEAIQNVKHHSLKMQNTIRDQNKKLLNKKKPDSNMNHFDDDDGEDEDEYEDPGFADGEFDDDQIEELGSDEDDYLEPNAAQNNGPAPRPPPPQPKGSSRPPPPVPGSSDLPPRRAMPPVPQQNTSRRVPSPPRAPPQEEFEETYEAVEEQEDRRPPPLPPSAGKGPGRGVPPIPGAPSSAQSRKPPPVPTPPQPAEPTDDDFYEELPEEKEQPKLPPPLPPSNKTRPVPTPPQPARLPPPPVRPPVQPTDDTYEMEEEGEDEIEYTDVKEDNGPSRPMPSVPPRNIPQGGGGAPGGRGPPRNPAPVAAVAGMPKLFDTVALRDAKENMRPTASQLFEKPKAPAQEPTVISGGVKDKAKQLDQVFQKRTSVKRESTSSSNEEGSGGSFKAPPSRPDRQNNVPLASRLPELPPSSNRDRALPVPELPPSSNRDRALPVPTPAERDRPLPQPPKNDKDGHLSEPWYFEHIDRKSAADNKIKDSNPKDGTFLIRPSTRDPATNPHALHVWFSSRVYCLHIRRSGNKLALGTPKPDEKQFDTIMEMVKYHRDVPIILAKNASVGEPGGEVQLKNAPSSS